MTATIGVVPSHRGPPAIDNAPPIRPEAAAAAAGMRTAMDAKLRDVSRSHWVHHLEADGVAVVVKQVRQDLSDTGRNLAHEAFVYRLAQWTPGVAAVLPRALLVDEHRGVLVLEALDPLPLGDVVDAAMVAESVAAMHAATEALPVPFEANSGVLHLPDTDVDELTLAAGGRQLAGEIRSDGQLVALLRAALAEWTSSSLIHADLKWDNVLSVSGSSRTVRIIDWELSGRGDPAWDVACWLAQGVALGGAQDRDCSPRFVNAYAEASGCGPEFWHRCARYCPARLVHLALETAEAGGNPELLITAARRLADRYGSSVASLRAWAGR